MHRIFIIIFLLTTYTSYGQSSKINIYAVIDGGLDQSMGMLTPESRHQNYYYFKKAESIASPGISSGLQMELLNRWTVTARFGLTGMGSAFKYQFDPLKPGSGRIGTSNILGKETRGHAWARRKIKYYNNGIAITGWEQPFMRIVVTEEYNFYRLRFRKGILNHLGLNFNAGVGLDYTFLSKKNRTDSLRPFTPPLSIGRMSVNGLEKQSRSGAGGLLAGLSMQILFKKHKYLKLGVWYHYIPHPNITYQMNLSYEENKEDNFKLYGAKRQWLFIAEIPIKLYDSNRRKK